MYWRAPKSASATALKLFEACCASECANQCVSDPALAKASVLSCPPFQAMSVQKLASVKPSSTTMTVNGDFTTFGTTLMSCSRDRMGPHVEIEVSAPAA